ncbi:MAG: PilZ domain-containing protein [Candidatus Omnitrophica bacterium]|nr:PilZ domain-containing protein [Candidatus Omnitrophota bacterium]MCF7895133.1 PilZ domain-containing protein [Candidatus Omnitrophota bacterium]
MKGDPKERRRFRRASFPCEIYILTAPLHVIQCKTENIGAGGVRVLIDENLPLHSIVGLKLYLSKKPIECRGKVVWIVKRKIEEKDFKFDIGLEFHQISSEDRQIIGIFVKSLV